MAAYPILMHYRLQESVLSALRQAENCLSRFIKRIRRSLVQHWGHQILLMDLLPQIYTTREIFPNGKVGPLPDVTIGYAIVKCGCGNSQYLCAKSCCRRVFTSNDDNVIVPMATALICGLTKWNIPSICLVMAAKGHTQ